VTIRATDRPAVILIRHFFVRLFDFELLSESSTGSLARTVTGIAGILAAIGALLARVFMQRYAALRETGDPAFFQAAILTDHTFLLAAPMWIVAFIAVLTGPSLFPDETDFRVLTPLPLERRLVFSAKLAALALFAGIFLAIAQISLLPLFFMTALGPLAGPPVVTHLPAFLAAGILGGAFAGFAVTAVHAVLLLLIPRERLLPLSAALGSVMLAALVLALPFVGRLPSFQTAFDRGALWLYLFPPAWFVGVERWLVGDTRFAMLAASAMGALFLAAGIAGAAYIALYRDFARVMIRPATDQGARLAAPSAPPRRSESRPAFAAIRTFTAATLRRSVLHQGVFVAISAIGAALVANSLLDLDLSPVTMSGRLRLADVVIWAPFGLSFVAILAVRAALLLPIDLRANWVFRITEQPGRRGDQLDAAASAVWWLGVFLPAVVLLPVQWWALGPVSFVTMLVAVLCGGVLAEAVLIDWHRIPFTCSYTVGKGFIPQLVLLGFLSFVGFTTVGRALAYGSSIRPPGFAVTLCTLLILAALGLRRHRRKASVDEPLQFEDALPTEANPLRLQGD
jgi:hypothetical protein